MFEQNQQFPQSQPAQPQTAPVPPTGGVMGQAQSPFLTPAEAAARQADRTGAPQALPVEDMFGAAETAPAADSYRPAPAAPQYQQNTRPISEAELFGSGKSFPLGKLLTVVIILVIIVLVAIAAYLGYNYLQTMNQNQAAAPTEIQQTSTATTVLTPATTTATTAATTTTTTLTVASDKADADGDGLTDAEEANLGTNATLADTDSDGLTDWAEIKIYKTDPLKQDTDGDTYKDGQEVINGYDPAIAGNARLFSVPQE